MLILIATWLIHNWWKLLIGVLAIIVILEYHYYRKPDREDLVKEGCEAAEGEKTENDKTEADPEEPEEE